MKFPTARQTQRIRIAEHLHQFGHMTCAELFRKYPAKTCGKWEFESAVKGMLDDGMLTDDKGVLTMSAEMHAWAADRLEIAAKRVKPEIVQPRRVNLMKGELNGSMYAGVRARLERDITFKNGLQTPVAFHRMEE